MNQETVCQCSVPENRSTWNIARRCWGDVKMWLYLNIWCRYCYRHVMRFAHRYNWHYAPPQNLIASHTSINIDFYGIQSSTTEQYHWCQWCGLRGTTYKCVSKFP